MWRISKTTIPALDRYIVGSYMDISQPHGGVINGFVPIFAGSWSECIKLVNYLNGGTGILPVDGWYEGVPVTPQ